jgi:hypothetical protein
MLQQRAHFWQAVHSSDHPVMKPSQQNRFLDFVLALAHGT